MQNNGSCNARIRARPERSRTRRRRAEVVLKGQLTNEGFHVAPNGVMAKCPSKYEQKKVS